MGSTGQQLEVVYDTGSDWLCVESIDCKNGRAQKFNYNDSKSLVRLESEESRREYGSAVLNGVEVKDITCLAPYSSAEISGGSAALCKPDFEWFMVSSERGLNDDYAGVIGLARSKFKPGEGERDEGPLLVKEMADDGVLDANVFAIYMTSKEEEEKQGLSSFIDFGAIKE